MENESTATQETLATQDPKQELEGVNGKETQAAGESEEVQTFTKEEVDAKIQSEADKRVTQAIKTANAKNDEIIAQKVQEVIAEQQKIAEMDKDQLRKYEQEQAQAKIDALTSELELKNLKDTAVSLLQSKSLDISLSDFILDKDCEVMENRLDRISSVIEKEVQRRIDLVKGGSVTPKSSGTGAPIDTAGMTSKELLKHKRST